MTTRIPTPLRDPDDHVRGKKWRHHQREAFPQTVVSLFVCDLRSPFGRFRRCIGIGASGRPRRLKTEDRPRRLAHSLKRYPVTRWRRCNFPRLSCPAYIEVTFRNTAFNCLSRSADPCSLVVGWRYRASQFSETSTDPHRPPTAYRCRPSSRRRTALVATPHVRTTRRTHAR